MTAMSVLDFRMGADSLFVTSGLVLVPTAHTFAYAMGTGCYFLEGKAVEECIQPFASV
jgi:hypothetical protein